MFATACPVAPVNEVAKPVPEPRLSANSALLHSDGVTAASTKARTRSAWFRYSSAIGIAVQKSAAQPGPPSISPALGSSLDERAARYRAAPPGLNLSVFLDLSPDRVSLPNHLIELLERVESEALVRVQLEQA